MKAASILATLAGAAFGAWCVWKASMTGWAVPGSGTPTAPAGQHPPRVEPSGNTCRLDLKGSPVQQTQGFDYWYANQSDAWLSPFVIPSHRLVFCYVPKCGTSRWQTFLRWLVGVQDWASNPHNRDANGYIGGLMQLKHLPRAEAIQIMLDPSWTKMAVVRDPLDRLRSAYLDKIAGGNDPNNTHLTKDLFGLPYEAFNATNFPDFVTRVEFGMHHALEHENPHWQRQSRTCDLGKFLPFYQHVFFMAPDKSMRAELSDCFIDAVAKTAPNPSAVRNFSFGESAKALAEHRTDAKDHATYDEQLCQKARQLYAEDYELFRFPQPTCLRDAPHVTWPAL
ncbi:CHST8 [Symbiodinium natans]|uniref:CHST8 protein n=1 Tax=Symbiodinium natans TaxID=878477 RepID=A0A812MLT8_9DINO|nr:CHST8 [Symbiodinium natans]